MNRDPTPLPPELTIQLLLQKQKSLTPHTIVLAFQAFYADGQTS
jgi:hypothetical protein